MKVSLFLLLSTKLVAKIRSSFDINISILEIFKNRKFVELAAFIESEIALLDMQTDLDLLTEEELDNLINLMAE